MTMTFYARGDSSSANNAALNAQGANKVATTELEFTSAPGGNFVLDYNGGAADPDTVVLVDGVEMTFTVEFSGTLPTTNKLRNVNGEDLRGEEIVVITTQDGQRFFFLTNGTTSFATMDSFPNGAHAIESIDSTSDVLVCFMRGTRILTPQGEVPVEALTVGDQVINADGNKVTLRWISSRKLSSLDLMLQPKFRPVCILRGSLGQHQPTTDLWVSPWHRVVVGGYDVELMYSQDQVFVAAKHLVNAVVGPAETYIDEVEYIHLLFDQHEVIFANGLATESLYPGDVAIASLSKDDRDALSACLQRQGRDVAGYGPTALTALTGQEAGVLRMAAHRRQFNLPKVCAA